MKIYITKIFKAGPDHISCVPAGAACCSRKLPSGTDPTLRSDQGRGLVFTLNMCNLPRGNDELRI